MSVPDEGYSRNTSCTLNYISTFLFILDEICPRVLFAKYFWYFESIPISFKIDIIGEGKKKNSSQKLFGWFSSTVNFILQTITSHNKAISFSVVFCVISFSRFISLYFLFLHKGKNIKLIIIPPLSPLIEWGLYCNLLVRPSVRPFVRPSVHTFVTDISASTGRNDFIFDIWL